MLDEQQTFRGRIMSVEAVAVRVACEDPQAADPLSIVDRSPSATEALVLDTGHAGIANADEQASHAIETEQSRSSITQETAVWTGEVKAPTPEEALRSLLPRDNGRLRVGILSLKLDFHVT